MTPAKRSVKPHAVMPGSTVDVKINVVGPASADAGATFTYTVTISNNSLNDADGAAFTNSVPVGATNVAASCAAITGASCGPALSVSNSTVDGSAGALPHLGVVTITITGRFAAPSATSVTDSAHVDPPTGTTDSDISSNDSSVSTSVDSTADVHVVKSQANASMSPSNPNTYTVTYTNDGPAAADGAYIFDIIFPDNKYLYSGVATHLVSCTGTTAGLDAACSNITDQDGSQYNDFNFELPSFPAGSSLTVIYTGTPVTATTPACGDIADPYVENNAGVNVPTGFTDPNLGNNQATVTASTPGPDPCPQADVRVVKSQANSSMSPSNPNTYTVTYTNDGPTAADGTSVYDQSFPDTRYLYSGVATHLMSCTGTTAGLDAACSNITDQDGSQYNVYGFDLPSFPAGSSLTVVYTGTPVTATTPACGDIADPYVENDAGLNVPTGVTDPNSGNNRASVTASTPGPDPCPQADVRVVKSQANSSMSPSNPNTYTVTYTNDGPAAADGTYVYDQSFPDTRYLYSGVATHLISCTGTTAGLDATCSNIADQDGSQYNVYGFDLPSFPAGSSLTVVYTGTPVYATTPSCGNIADLHVENDAGLIAPNGVADPNSDNNRATVTASTPCHDISVNKTVTPSSVQATDAVAFDVTVTNATPGDATSVEFSDPLPSGFVYAGATCTESSGASQCGTLAYDLATRTVSSTISTVGGSGGSVTITISGAAGLVPGTYKNTATAVSGIGADAFYDPNSESNASIVSLQIFNDASKIVVTKTLTGLPTAGLGAALTFTGQITCATQGSKPWTVTIPAGVTSAMAAAVLFFDGDSCTITEDAPPTAPEGYYYSGNAAIDPATIAVLGPKTTVAVTSTTPLAVRGALEIDKTVDIRYPRAGESLTYTVTVRNIGAVDATGVTATDTLPAGITVTAISGGGVQAGTQITWSNVSVASKNSAIYTVTASVDAGAIGTLSNAFAVTNLDHFEPVTVDHPCAADASHSCAVSIAEAVGQLEIDKTVDKANAAHGDTLTYTLTVHNTGQRDATDVAASDALPAGLTFTSATGGGTPTGTDVNWTIASIAAGDTATLTVKATVDAGTEPEVLTNSFTVVNPADFDPVTVDAPCPRGEVASCATTTISAITTTPTTTTAATTTAATTPPVTTTPATTTPATTPTVTTTPATTTPATTTPATTTPATTTLATTTTTTATRTTATTTPATTTPATTTTAVTTASPDGSTSENSISAVAPTSTTSLPTTPSGSYATSLPNTGASVIRPLIIGFVMLLLGAIVLLISRRRRSPGNHT